MSRGMQHVFSMVPSAEIQRSSFDRSHGMKTTFGPGYLYPIFVDEVLPGDTFNVNMTGLVRLSTPLHPLMDNIYLNSFFFFVPNRLLWANWQRFNGEQDTPGASTDYLVPEITAPAGGFLTGSIADYFGLPIGVSPLRASALYFRAYNLIWNEWFRDENLQQPVGIALGDGPDDGATYRLLRRGKRHDYFTSSLPWPQKGESVSIPLGTTAPVGWVGDGLPTFTVGGSTGGLKLSADAGGRPVLFDNAPAGGGLAQWDQTKLHADLSEATAATINQLRQAFAVQRLYERDARGGTRYTEILRAHFGVISPDARLQRPEYLGGGQSYVNVTQVPQTSAGADSSTPQGHLGAYGTSVMSGHGFSKSFTEHGVLIGLVSVRSDMNYQQGLERFWSRRRRFDYYWPALSHIGEQTVLNKEIYMDGTASDDAAWGFQERYAEYRYKPSKVTGLFRSQAPGTLDSWHLAQYFGNRPALNSQFIEENPDIARTLAVQNQPEFIGDFWFKMRCARPMPVYGVPGMIDHF